MAVRQEDTRPHRSTMASSGTRVMFVLFLTLVLAVEIATGVGEGPWLGTDSSNASNPAPASAPASSAEGICLSRVVPYGYQCEEYTVVTQDGYILAMQRIPAGRSGSSGVGGDKTPVLLQHGLMMDGATWLLNSPDQSLAFILADSGFDVWIANTRGTDQSRGHSWLAPDDTAYWDWSWVELAEYDLPAMVNYVYGRTGKRLHFVGHSLGTLVLLASFSQQQQLLNTVRSAGLLCPIAYLGHITSTLTKGAADLFAAEAVYWMGMNEFNPKGIASEKLLQSLCNKPKVDCYHLLASLTGKNCCLNSSSIDMFLQYVQPTSTKNMVHLAQMARADTITKYDYGKLDNLMHYGHLNPPSYDMSAIPADFPLFISYGGLDELADVTDVSRLLGILDSAGADSQIQYQKSYAHMDFVMGLNATTDVYDPLVAFFNHH